MRILLILPFDLMYHYGGFFSRSISYAPLTLTTLAALVPDGLAKEITIVDEGVQSPDYSRMNPDLVGITCVASSAPRAYELAEYWEDRGATVVIGGAHPSLAPDEVLAHVPSVVAGPAEGIWPSLLADFAAGRSIDGLHDNTEPADIPWHRPRRDLLQRGLYMKVPTILASRGCSNRCTFCSVNRIWSRRTYSRPVEEVVDEIQSLDSKRILFLDPNLVSNRDYAMELFEALIPLDILWAGLATVDTAFDGMLLAAAARSGCRGILTGFESLAETDLKESRKNTNDPARYIEAVSLFHGAGISLLGCFVVGFDDDDEHVFERLLDFVDVSGIDVARYAVLTPFPGTPLYDRMKEDRRILTEDRLLYDSEHVVFQPAGMSPEALEQGFINLWKRTYSINRILGRARRADAGLSLLSLAVNNGFRRYIRRLKARRSVSV